MAKKTTGKRAAKAKPRKGGASKEAVRALRVLQEADIDVARIAPELEKLAHGIQKKAGDRPRIGDRADFGSLQDHRDTRDGTDFSTPDWTDGKK